MTEAADRAREANAHFLRARVSIVDPTVMELIAGCAVLATAIEALAVELHDMKQKSGFICEKSHLREGWLGHSHEALPPPGP
jgi:uncharacterized protein (DUF2141 family)